MKFWAKLRCKEEKNAENLIRAFFKEFNPESSIVIRGKEVKIEIIFNSNPPMELIEEINNCDVMEFNFGKALEEYNKDVTQQEAGKEKTSEETEQVVEEETSEQTEQAVVEEETYEQTEQPKNKRGRPKIKKAANVKTLNIPQLEEIAKKAISFEHFVKLVAEWLDMDMRQEFFVNVVMAGTEVEKMSWKELENILKNKDIFYTQWDKTWIGNQISKKIKDYSIRMLPFLNAMVQYKDYSFKDEQSDENYTEQKIEEIVTNVKEAPSSEIEETMPKNRVKMECMPEIPHFEEILGSVDKTQPIEDRVRYVLTAMGWEKENAQKRQEIFKIANTAVRIRKMDFDIIFSKANIHTNSLLEVRMAFCKFINDFISAYDSDKKVKLLDFLKELQEIVMYESEIESFTDVTD